MDNKVMIQEKISTLVDGEVAKAQVPAILDDLKKPEEMATWDIYHHIGDVLRSDEMALSLSPGFAKSLSARLAAEPTIMAPAAMNTDSLKEDGPYTRTAKRYAMPGLAVAASIAAFVFVIAPQVAFKGSSNPEFAATSSSPLKQSVSQPGTNAPVASIQQEGVILRDPQMDQYLSAHQRYSPSAYSIAQYARSASFESDNSK
jgi:sigma-E factor negative regulatory protein RseA